MSQITAWIFWWFLSAHICHCLYFLLPETEKKCFLEEIPDETTVVGKYRIEQVDANNLNFVQVQGMSRQIVTGVHVEVKDPENHVVMSRAYGSKGKFSFTSTTAGDHHICLWTNSTRWFGGSVLRIHFNMSTGEHANDYQEIAASGKLTEIQLRVRQLMDQILQISKEQHYQRVREEKFRLISEHTNSRVVLWAIFQTGVLLAVGFWQMKHLKSFFRSKKVV